MFVRIKDNNKFFKYVKMIMDTTIKGSKYIEKVNIRSEGERFIVETEGIDLMHLKTLQSIDHSKTQCNDIFAIRKVFGIEAARAVLLKEMHQVLAAYGIYVNHRHLMVIIDWMTWGGTINALTRHGVKKMMDDSTPLKRATFEQPVEIFHHASVKGLKDTLSGVSEQLLIGNAPKIGSYYNDVIIDQEYQKMWDNDDWKPEEIVEEDLFGDWTGSASSWDSHQTFANENKVAENKAVVLREQQNSAWRGLQELSAVRAWKQQQAVPAWQQQQAPVPAWQTNQAPSQYVPISPNYCPGESPPTKKQKLYSPTNVPVSPSYAPVSPSYAPISPNYAPSESPPSKKQKLYSPTTNNYSPTSPYSPVSPAYSPISPNQKIYSPSSPAYESPPSKKKQKIYSPVSPAYSPISPNQKIYSPTNNNSYSPTSPYSPVSPAYSPISPNQKIYSPSSPAYESPPSKKQKI